MRAGRLKIFFYIPLLTIIGVVISLIISTLVDKGVLVITGPITLTSWMTIIVAFCITLGLILGVIENE